MSEEARFVRLALGHVGREYPHALVHVLAGPEDALTPRALHPAFYGSFDWHSCVHAFWLLAVCLRRAAAAERAPEWPEWVEAVRALFDVRLGAGPIAAECAYLARPQARGFERPYGWAWALALHHALRGTPWAPTVEPLAAAVAARFHAFLPRSPYPVRAGTHFNTAFALRLTAPWAAANDPALLALLEAKAAEWYGADQACQAWEPSQDDFLSPALIEAACMRRLLPGRFDAWFAAFLPERVEGRPATLFRPATVTDRSDGKIAHLDGLNLSRAWCWQELGHPSPVHIEAALPHIQGDFAGEHWLATFAALALWPGVLEG